MGREWNATTVSTVNGTFTISGVCATDLKLTARKKGFESAYQEYIVTPGDIVSVVMTKLGECNDLPSAASMGPLSN